MLAHLNRWLYWGLAIFGALGAVLMTHLLHQLRPDNGALVLTTATFSASPAVDPEQVHGGTMVSLPDDWRDREIENDVGWYQLEQSLDVAPNRLWGLYATGLEMTPAAYVNGVLVGGDEAPAQPLPRYWNRPLLYAIPNGLLKPGRNTIDIRLAANGPWGRLSEIYLGPYETLLSDYEPRHFWRVTFLYVTTAGSLILALFMGALNLVRRERIYLWFSGFSLAWFLHNLLVLTVRVPINNAAWDLAVYASIGMMVGTGSIFTFRFLGVERRTWERVLVWTTFGGPLLLVPVLLFDVALFNSLGSTLWLAVLLLLAFYPLALMARAMLRQRTVEVFFLTVCYVMAVCFGAHDWLVTTGLGYRHDGLFLQFAAAPTLATFGIILLRRFIGALRETDLLNRELEERVDEKAREIEASFLRNQQLESAQLLSRERERIMRDMHDGVGSQLIGMLGHLRRDDPRDRELSTELRDALHDLRLMIDSLDDVENDVVVALGLFRNRIQPQLDAVGVTIQWNISDLPPVPGLGPERVLQFLRILQEAVTNCIKHAAATRLTFDVAADGIVDGQPCVSVSIADDGVGIDAQFTPGRGLSNMRQRAFSAGLLLEIHSDRGGTRVCIGFPIH